MRHIALIAIGMIGMIGGDALNNWGILGIGGIMLGYGAMGFWKEDKS
jgi:hypothetical protein